MDVLATDWLLSQPSLKAEVKAPASCCAECGVTVFSADEGFVFDEVLGLLCGRCVSILEGEFDALRFC